MSHKNHLFDPQNGMQNIAFKHRQNLISKGLKVSDTNDPSVDKELLNYSLAFKFIKMLSSFKSLEFIWKELQEKDVTSIVQSHMHKALYKYL